MTVLHECYNTRVHGVVSAVKAILAPLLTDQVDTGVDPGRLASCCGDRASVDHDSGFGIGGRNAMVQFVGHPSHGLHAALIDLRILLGALKTSDDLLLKALQLTR